MPPSFWKPVFSESDGTPSFSRIVSALVTTFALGWVTAIVWSHIKAHTEPILPDFGGLAMFISIFYGLNVGSRAIARLNGGTSKDSGRE